MVGRAPPTCPADKNRRGLSRGGFVVVAEARRLSFSPGRDPQARAVAITDGRLSRGNHYTVIKHDPAGDRYRLKGDNGRTRWFPAGLFIVGKVDVPRIAGIEICDSRGAWDRMIVEVVVALTSGERRLSHFATPATVLSAGPHVGDMKVRYQ